MTAQICIYQSVASALCRLYLFTLPRSWFKVSRELLPYYNLFNAIRINNNDTLFMRDNNPTAAILTQLQNSFTLLLL